MILRRQPRQTSCLPSPHDVICHLMTCTSAGTSLAHSLLLGGFLPLACEPLQPTHHETVLGGQATLLVMCSPCEDHCKHKYVMPRLCIWACPSHHQMWSSSSFLSLAISPYRGASYPKFIYFFKFLHLGCGALCSPQPI